VIGRCELLLGDCSVMRTVAAFRDHSAFACEAVLFDSDSLLDY
jgi:hypothetical protein